MFSLIQQSSATPEFFIESSHHHVPIDDPVQFCLYEVIYALEFIGESLKFNNVYKVNKGHYGSVKLDGAKFWLSGDLGPDFSAGRMDWAVVTFDKATGKEQRDAISAILPHVFPVKWNSFTTAEGNIDTWEFNKDMAHATLDGGKTAEVKLHRVQGMTDNPVVIKNLKYWGAPRNDGFVMMPNDVQAYRTGDKAYEFKGTNGFMLTLDITSKDVKQ